MKYIVNNEDLTPIGPQGRNIDVTTNPFRQCRGRIVNGPVVGPVVQVEVTVHAIAGISQPDHGADFLLRPVLLTLGGNESDDVPPGQMLCAVPDEPDHYLVEQRMEDLLEQVVAGNDRDTILPVSRPHRRRLSNFQVPAIHVERLTKLRKRTDVVIALPDVVEIESAEIQNTFVLGRRQPFVFVFELVRAAQIELPSLDEIL